MATITAARAACPELVLVDGSDLAPFRRAAARVRACVRAHLPENTPVEYAGLDELFIDATDVVASRPHPPCASFHGHLLTSDDDSGSHHPSTATTRALQAGSALAAELRSAVRAETGLRMCGGVAGSKLGAKLAASAHKPDDQTTFASAAAIAHFLALRPPTAIPGFGRAHAARLAGVAPVATVAALRTEFPPGREAVLARILDVPRATADWIVRAAAGRDDRPVKQSGAPGVVSCEDAMRTCNDVQTVRRRLRELGQSLVARLAEDASDHGSRVPGTLVVKFRFCGAGHKSTARAVPMPASVLASCADTAINDVVGAAIDVLGANGVASIPTAAPSFALSLLGLGATNFTAEAMPRKRRYQSSLDISHFLRTITPTPLSTAPPSKHRNMSLTPSLSLVMRSTSDPTPASSHCQPRLAFDSIPIVDDQELTLACTVCKRQMPRGTSMAELKAHLDTCMELRIDGSRPKQKRRRFTEQRTRLIDSFFCRD
jgi:nucleotidyltransferase/DNA polymerase involved in DNA repair